MFFFTLKVMKVIERKNAYHPCVWLKNLSCLHKREKSQENGRISNYIKHIRKRKARVCASFIERYQSIGNDVGRRPF